MPIQKVISKVALVFSLFIICHTLPVHGNSSYPCLMGMSLPEVHYKMQFITALKNKLKSEVVKSIPGTKTSYQLSRDELFVHAKIISIIPKENSIQFPRR